MNTLFSVEENVTFWTVNGGVNAADSIAVNVFLLRADGSAMTAVLQAAWPNDLRPTNDELRYYETYGSALVHVVLDCETATATVAPPLPPFLRGDVREPHQLINVTYGISPYNLDHDFLHGARVGEAQHPGPVDSVASLQESAADIVGAELTRVFGLQHANDTWLRYLCWSTCSSATQEVRPV